MIKRQNGGISETFTVRKISYGVGVERTFPLHSPRVDKIEVVRRGLFAVLNFTIYVIYVVKLHALKNVFHNWRRFKRTIENSTKKRT